MKPPCEMVVWYIIPAIRSELAKDLLKLGMKQKKISELMDITQPAVSQYLDDVKALIQDFANDLNEGTATKLDIIPRTCYICKRIKTEDVICQIHKEKGHMPADCRACLGSEAHLL